MKRFFLFVAAALLPCLTGRAEAPAFADKTLVVWAAPANLVQRGGSALSLDDNQTHFDGIVFGEVSPGKWMAGSDYYKRTEKRQDAWSAETADSGTFVQLAVVYRGKEVAIYRNEKEIARYAVEAQLTFGKDSVVLMGQRHLAATDHACFAGAIDDARIYDVALAAEQLAALKPNEASNPQPKAWWTFEDGAKDRMGFFPDGKLVGAAHVENGKLILDGRGSSFVAPASAAPALPPPPYASPIHFRPAVGALADTIPLFYKGQYHVFYLHAEEEGTPWEHIVSDDLVHWKELPTALRLNRDDAQGPDGGNMFTGSVIEHQGTYHIFYTGHNPNNPKGMEFVCHATSPDGIAWTKHPEQAFGADGVHYQPKSDFRDPYVFWNEAEQCFWMLLCARHAGSGKPAQGVARSKDLVTWEQIEPLTFDPPLAEGTPECPDAFKCGDTWYLVHSPSAGTTDIRWTKDLRGPWHRPESGAIDTPILYAAKRMTDGKRHVLTGWVRDLDGFRDNGGWRWGGTQSLPREAYGGPNGQLYFKPAAEVVAVFSKLFRETKMTIRSGASAVVEVPDHYMADCRVKLDPGTELTVSFRQQADKARAYRLVVRPGKREAEICGPGFSSKRPCPVDCSKPVKIQAFLQGTILECFINDQYAFSWRAYDLPHGALGLSVEGGSVDVESLQVRLPPGASQAISQTPGFPAFFYPEQRAFGDTFPIYRDGVWHLFAIWMPQFGHFVSKDLVHWEARPPTPFGGCTGSVVEKDGTYYFFYTGGGQQIWLATSKDLENWTPCAGNPLLVGDGKRYDPGYFRDPYVFFEPTEKKWWMLMGSQYVANRKPGEPTGCVALAKSDDLLHWELSDPLWAPRMNAHCDCPQVFHQGDLWYLTYLHNTTRYRTARTLAGPWERPPLASLGTMMAAAGSRPASDGKRWISWPFVFAQTEASDTAPINYGGPLCVPREWVFREDGRIAQRVPVEVVNALHAGPAEGLPLDKAEPVVGEWKLEGGVTARSTAPCGGILRLPNVPADFYLEADLALAKTDMEANVLLGYTGDRFNCYSLSILPRENLIKLRTTDPCEHLTLETLPLALDIGRPIKLRIFRSGSIFEVFIDEQAVLTKRLYRYAASGVGLELRDGGGSFSNLLVRRLAHVP